jgi:hypothetical protein
MAAEVSGAPPSARTGPHRAPPSELVSAGAAVLLVIATFAFKWYGVDGIPGRSELYRTVNAWHSLSIVRWLILATVLAALLAPLVHAIRGWAARGVDAGLAVPVLASLTAVLLVYRVLISFPSAHATLDQKLGAYLGVLATVAIALASYDAFRTARARRAPGTRP